MRIFLKFLVAGCLVWQASASVLVSDDLRKSFDNFKIKYNKKYSNQIRDLRAFRQFVKVFRIVEAHNKKFVNDLVDFDLAINHFADLVPAELEKFSTGNFDAPYDFRNFTVRPKEVITVTETMFPPGPAAVDWRASGHVTPVKDQGFHCNSCWAFSAVAALESALSIKTGTLKRGSEQNLIDCNRNDETGNFGCRGGSQSSAYMYVQFQPGISDEDSYPYEETVKHPDPLKCRYRSSTSIGTTRGYARILPGNETLLRDVVASVGPVAFALNGETDTFLYYKSGILDDPKCTPGTGHSALIYGYGTAKLKSGRTIDYWLCKNSWSSQWGDNGYFKMVRGKNMCGLTSYLIYPLV